jgi:hypothetical protein
MVFLRRTYFKVSIPNNFDLDLTNCPGMDASTEIKIDLAPVMTALRHNTFFKSITIKNAQVFI